MSSNASRAILTFCGISLAQCLVGCGEWNITLKLATMPSGDTIHVNDCIKDFKLVKREVVYRHCHQDNREQTVTVRKEGQLWANVTPEGYDVFQDRHRVTVCRILGRSTKPLTVIDIARARRGENPFLQPASNGRPTGRRIACKINRDLIRVKVPDGGTVRLSMFSVRDAGSGEGDSNSDRLWLDYASEKRHGLTVETEGAGQAILNLTGDKCAADPFRSCPRVDVRWDRTRRAAWVVDHETKRFLGGVRLNSRWSEDKELTFAADAVRVPEWTNATAGTLIASTAVLAEGSGDKRGGR